MRAICLQLPVPHAVHACSAVSHPKPSAARVQLVLDDTSVSWVLQVDKSIIGWDSTVGAWSRLENHCVLGEDVQVKVRFNA